MRYACDVCGERFFVHGHMKRHLYSHTGIKPHACRWKCGAIFASYGGRMKHERAQHSENPYKLDCDICGRPFRYISALKLYAVFNCVVVLRSLKTFIETKYFNIII